jgi:hypothetical protein
MLTKIRPPSLAGANSSGSARKVSTPASESPSTDATISQGRRFSCRSRRS